ncbi:MAG TPA: acetyltransferase [Rheinheimera sp.]|uniref:arylamine N-acetyltransferase family protein n=1 Tax=Rheinheimera sp. TaxID=1869214 RepID=UPI000EED25A8|nr:arylamine N-acetyltransferase [Rheinheimera sp.]HCU64269.1 acetyltransferase [Rheinheimera sp.]
MYASNFSLELYLQRIGYQQQVKPDIATVTALMQQQLRSIAFENLDVQAKKVVSLEPEQIVNKIVGNDGKARRGGYCYEVNGLFAMAMTALGLEYQFVFCRPMFYPMRRPKTHMALLVKVQGQQLLCDLGFGSYGLRAPIALSEVNLVQQQDFDLFRLVSPEPGQYVLQAQLDNNWVNQYGFDLYPADWLDFMPANFLNSTHPDTIFVQKLLIILQTPQGRKMLVGNEFKQTVAGVTQVQQVEAAQVAALLEAEFGLKA